MLRLTIGASDSDNFILSRANGCILVFMPGVPEIQKTLRLLQDAIADVEQSDDSSTTRIRIVTMALHGALSPSEQSQVFRPAAPGTVKLVVSTNVAEVPEWMITFG